MEVTYSTDEDLRPGQRVWGMVCDALIAPDGTTHYAEACGHEDAASAMGFVVADDAVKAGYAYVAISSASFVESNRPLTDAQTTALLDMYAVAVASRTKRCLSLIKAVTDAGIV